MTPKDIIYEDKANAKKPERRKGDERATNRATIIAPAKKGDERATIIGRVKKGDGRATGGQRIGRREGDYNRNTSNGNTSNGNTFDKNSLNKSLSLIVSFCFIFLFNIYSI